MKTRIKLLFIAVLPFVLNAQDSGNSMMSAVTYEAFGAKGDGMTDDFDAIVRAHEYANEHKLPVRANDKATYYIGGADQTAIIQTDTDFGTAQFVIDDTALENRSASIFEVPPSQAPVQLEGIASLRRNQPKINAALPGASVVIVRNTNVMHYIRFGVNQNKGRPQTDVFLVDAQGNVDPDSPILWDFDQVTEATAYPLDETPLRITGGRFTTIASQNELDKYHSRGILIKRSNVVVDGFEHRVTEGDQSAPYGGILVIINCANVTIQNSVFTGRMVPPGHGSYDIQINRAINVSFLNCRQTNDINDTKFWGIMGSNHCKNLLFDHCTFSRFDAHMGVANATIRNSKLGYMGVQLIGQGTFLMENTTVYSQRLINLRQDYGSTWQGEFIIRNCTFVPRWLNSLTLIGGYNSGQHDFGYTCYMPSRITIENLHIDDANAAPNHPGPTIFADFNPEFTSDAYNQPYPYVTTREVILRNVTTGSGKPLRVSDNTHMFRNVVITREDDDIGADVITESLTATADTHVRSASAQGNNNFGGADQMLIGNHNDLGDFHGFLRFDLSGLGDPDLIQIQSVTLEMVKPQTGVGSAFRVSIYELSAANSAWVEGTANGAAQSGSATWDSKGPSAWAGSGGASIAGTDYIDTELAFYEGSITAGDAAFTSQADFISAVSNSWGGFLNLGVGINNTASGQYYRFSTTEHDTAAAPQLVIKYIPAGCIVTGI